MSIRATALLALFSLSLVGCDEGGGDPNDEFRDGTSCLKTGQTTTTKLVIKGVDPDWWFKEHSDVAVKFAPEQADEMVIAMTASHPKIETICKEVCGKEELDWTGDTCVGARDYTVGEFESYETEEAEPRWRVEIDTGKTEGGCVCE